MDSTYSWLKAGHLIGVVIWIGSMFAVYWLLRMHAHAPKDAHEKLTLMERSMALMMDLAATLAMALGIALIFYQPGNENIFAQKPAGWFHIKLTIIVLGLLSSHGILRARIKKFSSGKVGEVPSWLWSVILLSVVSIIIVVFVVRDAMRRSLANEKPTSSLVEPAPESYLS
jgi:protoporphyrinogen IX oxidase